MNLLKLSIASTDYDHFRDFRTGAVRAVEEAAGDVARLAAATEDKLAEVGKTTSTDL